VSHVTRSGRLSFTAALYERRMERKGVSVETTFFLLHSVVRDPVLWTPILLLFLFFDTFVSFYREKPKAVRSGGRCTNNDRKSDRASWPVQLSSSNSPQCFQPKLQDTVPCPVVSVSSLMFPAFLTTGQRRTCDYVRRCAFAQARFRSDWTRPLESSKDFLRSRQYGDRRRRNLDHGQYLPGARSLGFEIAAIRGLVHVTPYLSVANLEGSLHLST